MRQRRIHGPGLIYHAINRGNNRQAIFMEEVDYEKYLGLLYRFKKKYSYKLFAYCLMTNHVHLLIQVGNEHNISQIMQALTTAHTRHYHFKYQTSGHVWQGRFTSPIVSNDDHLLAVMQYIEQNPVRAKMVSSISQYPWSSYKLNSRKKTSKLIDRDDNPVFTRLGKSLNEQIRQYRSRMAENLNEQLITDIRKSNHLEFGFTSDAFKAQIQNMLKRKRIGRPRKLVSKALRVD